MPCPSQMGWKQRGKRSSPASPAASPAAAVAPSPASQAGAAIVFIVPDVPVSWGGRPTPMSQAAADACGVSAAMGWPQPCHLKNALVCANELPLDTHDIASVRKTRRAAMPTAVSRQSQRKGTALFLKPAVCTRNQGLKSGCALAPVNADNTASQFLSRR